MPARQRAFCSKPYSSGWRWTYPYSGPKDLAPARKLNRARAGVLEFRQDLDSLLSTFERFCDVLPTPLLPHPIFGPMTAKDWMRWGYLHADHHLRQFGR